MEEETYYEEVAVMDVEGEEGVEYVTAGEVFVEDGVEYVYEEVYTDEAGNPIEYVEEIVEEVMEEPVAEPALAVEGQTTREAQFLSACRQQLTAAEVDAYSVEDLDDAMDYDEDPDEFGGGTAPAAPAAAPVAPKAAVSVAAAVRAPAPVRVAAATLPAARVVAAPPAARVAVAPPAVRVAATAVPAARVAAAAVPAARVAAAAPAARVAAGVPARVVQQEVVVPDDDLVPCQNGYVFVCSNVNEKSCELFQLMGSPDWEMNQMTREIKEKGATAIFLFNLQTLMLYGPLKAVGPPRRNVDHRAFDGKYTSQVRVAPEDNTVWQVKMATRVKAGPKSLQETEELRNKLYEGEPVSKERQMNWSKPLPSNGAAVENGKRPLQPAAEEPPWKQQRVSVQEAKASPYAQRVVAPKAPVVAKTVVAKAPVAKPAQPTPVIRATPVATAKQFVVKVMQPAGGRPPAVAVVRPAVAKVAVAKSAVAQPAVAKVVVQPAGVAAPAKAAAVRPAVAKVVVTQALRPGAPAVALQPPATAAAARPPVAKIVSGVPAPKLAVAKAPVAAGSVTAAAAPRFVVKAGTAAAPAPAKAVVAKVMIAKAPVIAKSVVAKVAFASAPVTAPVAKSAVNAAAVGKTAGWGSGAQAPPAGKAAMVKAALAQPPAAGARAALTVTGQAAAAAAAKAVAAKAVAAKALAEAEAARAAAVKAAAERAVAAKAAAARAAAKAAAAARASAPAETFKVGDGISLTNGDFAGLPAFILSIEEGDITVLVNGTDVVVTAASELRKVAAGAAAAVLQPAAEDPEALRAELLEKREALRQLVIRPDYVAPFLNRGRLVYMQDAANDLGWGILLAAAKGTQNGQWAVKVFVAPSTSPAGQMRSLHLSRLRKISKVRMTLPAAPTDGKEAPAELLALLNKVRTHKKFSVEGIPELDPVGEMSIKEPAAAALMTTIADLEAKLTELGVSTA